MRRARVGCSHPSLCCRCKSAHVNYCRSILATVRVEDWVWWDWSTFHRTSPNEHTLPPPLTLSPLNIYINIYREYKERRKGNNVVSGLVRHKPSSVCFNPTDNTDMNASNGVQAQTGSKWVNASSKIHTYIHIYTYLPTSHALQKEKNRVRLLLSFSTDCCC